MHNIDAEIAALALSIGNSAYQCAMLNDQILELNQKIHAAVTKMAELHKEKAAGPAEPPLPAA